MYSAYPVDLSSLPVPDEDALLFSQELCHRIREAIKLNDNKISFARYMEMALYEPGLGYYSGGAVKFGKAGDFVTAPEISPLFAQCLARQCQQVISQLPQSSILELGPGSGRMACDLLLELEQNRVLPEKYFMLELSADLQQRQQQCMREKIPHLADRVIWLNQLPGHDFTGIILGNEVLDAMPVHRLVRHNDSFQELCVANSENGFIWVVSELNKQLQEVIDRVPEEIFSGLPEGYITEINPCLRPWMNSLSRVLAQGMLLLIDYGYTQREYYHPQRTGGSLLCHYRHHVHDDPFCYPGLQDITASVDFTAVAEAAVDAGLKVGGFTTQTHFLLNNGLEILLEQNRLTSVQDRAELGRQARLLTMPGEMGERIKVIAATSRFDIPLSGFLTFDQRYRL